MTRGDFVLPYDINELKPLLQKHDFTLSKSLGQNFLTSERVCEKIAQAAVSEGENVLEIGPGAGALTSQLCPLAKRLCAIEIDRRLLPILEEVVKYRNFTVVNQDFLKTDLSEIQKEYFAGEKYTVAGNLPYYISSKILQKLILQADHINAITVMVQKEFADRLFASAGSKDYRAITPTIQYFFNLSMILEVPPHCFLPAPDVTSSVVRLTPKTERSIPKDKEEKFLSLIQAGFAARRKQFCSVAKTFGYKREDFCAALEEMGKPSDIRAEALSTDNFVQLYNRLEKI